MNQKSYSNSGGWLWWTWDGVKRGKKIDRNSVWGVESNNPRPRRNLNYYDELYRNASLMKDEHPGKWDVLLSGGIDGEVVVRVLKDLGINHNTFIFKYENDYNVRDVASAVEICNSLNIKYSIIDFNLQKFYEGGEAWSFFKATLTPEAMRLPHLKFFDYLDNIPVMGDSEPYWKRELDGDYSSQSKWKFYMSEDGHTSSMYMYHLGRENIIDWYEYSPNLISSYNQLPVIQDLLNDKIPGKISSWSLRVPIHQKLWPDIKPKPKLTGYEGLGEPGTHPEWIKNLQTKITEEVGETKQLWLSQEEFNSLWGVPL